MPAYWNNVWQWMEDSSLSGYWNKIQHLDKLVYIILLYVVWSPLINKFQLKLLFVT